MPNDTLWSLNNPGNFLVLPQSYDSMQPEAQLALRKLIKEEGYTYEKPVQDNSGTALLYTLIVFFSIPILIYLRGKIRIRNVDYRITAEGERVDISQADYDDTSEETQQEQSPFLLYRGRELNFPDDAIAAMLSRRFPYFNRLSMPGQTKFLGRLKRFMAAKNFRIYDNSGFKEMPVLISASAIQLGFGLDHYMLASFTDIHIFPDAFLGLEPNIRFLEGNVSGCNIHVSWKHFLNGYQFPDNGENVGLHEMAHAFHIEYFSGQDHVCIAEFGWYEKIARSIFEQENRMPTGLYQSYYLRNMEEFWAGSIELFFERPEHMKAVYEPLYSAVCNVLKQYPAG
ncbi:MAG: zinc-dependent peptidase [Ferruginibacter sp.]